MKEGVQFAKGIFKIEDVPINWNTDKIVSFSQFSQYNTCPKKWELNYVRKEKVSDQNIYFVYGTVMHEIIQEYLYTCFEKTVKAANEMNFGKMLLEKLKTEYQNSLQKNLNVHFSSPEELTEFYNDGLEVLEYLRKKRTLYFPTKNHKLIAIELPLNSTVDENRPNIRLTSYLDIVIQNKVSGKYTIVDIKTSTKGWSKWEKEDKNKTDQLVLYKEYFCKRYKIPYEKVDINYFILRRKINPDSLWPIKRIQEFSPSHGKISINRVLKKFKEFLDNCFDENGKYIDKSHPAIAGKKGWNCTFCPFKDRHDLCPPENRIYTE